MSPLKPRPFCSVGMFFARTTSNMKNKRKWVTLPCHAIIPSRKPPVTCGFLIHRTRTHLFRLTYSFPVQSETPNPHRTEKGGASARDPSFTPKRPAAPGDHHRTGRELPTPSQEALPSEGLPGEERTHPCGGRFGDLGRLSCFPKRKDTGGESQLAQTVKRAKLGASIAILAHRQPNSSYNTSLTPVLQEKGRIFLRTQVHSVCRHLKFISRAPAAAASPRLLQGLQPQQGCSAKKHVVLNMRVPTITTPETTLITFFPPSHWSLRQHHRLHHNV